MRIMRTAISILAVLTAMAANADLTLRLTPGLLESKRSELSKATGKVTLNGTMSAGDFSPLAELTRRVTLLDMSGVRIEGSSTRIPDEKGRYVNPADRVPDHAFFQCQVKEIILPRTCEMGDATFAEAITEKVTLPNTMVRIPDHAFYRSGVKEILHAEGVRWIGKEAFAGSHVQTLAFPALVHAGDFSMAGMPELTEVTLPADARLGKGVLMDCPKLERIHGGVRILPEYFVANSSSAELSGSPSVIGEYALANSSAESIVFAYGLRSISEGACMGMTSLRRIYATQCGSIVPDVDGSAFQGLDVSAISLHVFPGSIERWKNHDVWGRFDILESLDSVDEIASDPVAISISLIDGMVEVESTSMISGIEVFSQNGFKILHASPETLRYSFPMADLKVKGAALVKVTNREGCKVMKILL